MTRESDRNKDLITLFIHRIAHDFSEETFDEFVSPGFVDYNAPPEQPPGVDGFKHILKRVSVALSDLKVDLLDIIAEGDKVVVRYTAEATHTGSFMGFPGTGKRIVINTISIYRIQKGKIAERWGLIDHANLLRQLRDEAK